MDLSTTKSILSTFLILPHNFWRGHLQSLNNRDLWSKLMWNYSRNFKPKIKFGGHRLQNLIAPLSILAETLPRDRTNTSWKSEPPASHSSHANFEHTHKQTTNLIRIEMYLSWKKGKKDIHLAQFCWKTTEFAECQFQNQIATKM